MDVFEPQGGDVLIRVKVVPGASRDRVVGVLGSRLKVCVSAPPEGGKANRAVSELIASALGVRARDVIVESGSASPEKTLRVSGVTLDRARQQLAP